MVVVFQKSHSNYDQQNIRYLLETIDDEYIRYIANNEQGLIKVIGDIHRSQWSSNNPNNYYWFKIHGYHDGIEITYLKSAHIHVCFREYMYDKRKKAWYPGDCINPSSDTDIAEVSKLRGIWEYRNITYR